MKSNVVIVIVTVLITLRIIDVIESKIQQHKAINQIKNAILPLDSRLQNVTFKSGKESKTIDKRIITLCLKDSTTQEFYKWNDIIFIALHEASHAISSTHDPDHTSHEFRDNFEILLRKAEVSGIYDPKQEFTQIYCGSSSDLSKVIR